MSSPRKSYDISYGPDENCTLSTCNIVESIYEYRPSLGANVAFLVLFGVALVIQIFLGIRWRTWAFLFAMFWGCVGEMVGYGGRIMLWQNPFSFPGFLTQIICLTTAPAFYSAAIYLTLSKIIVYLDPSVSRFSPKLYYWLFIPCDLLSLSLQAAGGASSSNSHGASQSGVNIAIAGLSFQVVTLTVFIASAVDYAIRYHRRASQLSREKLTRPFRIFVIFLAASILLILVRCAYRIDELSNGYSGPLIHDQAEFIVLEGVMVILAAFSLCIAHPGSVFAEADDKDRDAEKRSNGSMAMAQ